MGVKETPTNFRVYYKDMINAYNTKIEEAKVVKEELCNESDKLYNSIKDNIDLYKDKFNINLIEFEEFNTNRFIDGTLYKVAKGAFINRHHNYEIISELYDLFSYTKYCKEIKEINDDIIKYERCVNLSLKQYTEILKTYYTEVHKKLILEGAGYCFSNRIGWICINRCVLRKARPLIDFAATKKREAELKAEGKRIYNKTEADWCASHGIPYQAEDKRVFMTNEYCYEIPLIDSKLPNGTKLKLEITDYRHSSLRGKTNDNIAEMCNNDINKICEMPIDVKTKLTICDKVDNVLFTKFIRNENNQPIATPKANRKNR